MGDKEAGGGHGHGGESNAASLAVGVFFLIVFLNGPADGMIKLALVAAVLVYMAKK